MQLILGRTGTGKSRLVLEQAVEAAKAGSRVLVLVPEQFSFETERKVLAALRGSSALVVSVLSFSRLAELIFRTYGGLAGKRLTDMARLVLMKLAVQETADTLELYQRQSKRTDFLSTMLQTIEELKSSGTYPQTLRDMVLTLPESQLKAKLQDITAVYEVYQGIVERSYQDPLDDLARAAKEARGSGFFTGCHVFVDGFGFFSPPERELLEIILEQGESLTLSLTADGLGDGGPMDLFQDQKAAAHRFIQRAAQLGISSKKPIVLAENRRAKLPALAGVEAFMATGERVRPTARAGVLLVRGADKYDEIRYAAAEITRLVRHEGYRYRDCAVVCRNLADYQTALGTIFAAYEIPLFFDKKEPVTSRPVVAVVTAALDAVRGEWKTEALLRLARCPATGVSVEQAASLENYVYIWSVAGAAWEKPFAGSPGGLSGALSAADHTQLAGLEALRTQLITPLIALKKQLKKCTGGGFALGVYRYLTDTSAVEHLRAFFTDTGDEAGLAETDTLYNNLIDILDLFGDTMETVGFAAATFIEMFELALGCVELGKIPNTNDQTIAGSADRVRLDSQRAVFAVGVNEGVFPAKYQPYGVFSDTEREQLVQRGIELSASKLQRSLLERFFLYSTLCAPQERLYVTYAAAGLTGEAQEPALIVGQLAALLPNAATTTAALSTQEYVADLFTAREQYVRLLGASQQVEDLREALLREGDSGFLALADRLSINAPAEGITPGTAAALIGGKMKLSPTKIEAFYNCPYLYFCGSMLRLQKRKKVEYTPLESGSAIHFVLEGLLRELSGAGIAALSDKELTEKISALLTAFIASVTDDNAPLETRFKYQFNRLVSVLLLLTRHIGEDFEQSLFTPAGLEVVVDADGAVKPMIFTTKNGTELAVNGKIDRVDLFINGADRYARVVDYKSGVKDFKLDEVFYGLNMQMLIYLFSLCMDKTSPFGEVQPAGILYMPGKVSPAELPPSVDHALLRALVDDTLKMKGLLLEDETVLRAMERELAGRYIPAKVTQKGTLSASSAVKSAAEFAKIGRMVTEKIAQMGESLTEGKVAPLPARSNTVNPCQYCDYGPLCGNKNTTLFRDITLPAQSETEDGEAMV